MAGHIRCAFRQFDTPTSNLGMTTHPRDLIKQNRNRNHHRGCLHIPSSPPPHIPGPDLESSAGPTAAGPRLLTEWHCSQYTSWAFGQRIRAAGLLGSMGSVGDCYDNAMMESFWGTMQMELLDSRTWEDRDQLAHAIFEWIDCWYNPKRHHPGIQITSPATFEALHPRSVQDR